MPAENPADRWDTIAYDPMRTHPARWPVAGAGLRDVQHFDPAFFDSRREAVSMDPQRLFLRSRGSA
jgi:acyl transferase domain-containing protein